MEPLGVALLHRKNKCDINETLRRLKQRSSNAFSDRTKNDDTTGSSPPTESKSSRVPMSTITNLRQHTEAAPNFVSQQPQKRLVVAASNQHSHFQNSLNLNGMRLFPCVGDGNCLYRTVAHQVYGDQNFHNIIRNITFEYMFVALS